MLEAKQPHIRCGRSDAAPFAILPGDPERVERVKAFLDDPVDIAFNREYKSCRGSYQGVPVMVVSTGIGGASTGIAVEELRQIGVHTLIRIGSCGALQPALRLGELIIACGAVRDDGASRAYVADRFPAVPDTDLLAGLLASAAEQGFAHHCGLVHSHDSFYTDHETASREHWRRHGVLGADMETSALLVIARLRGLRAASILNVVVEHSGDIESGINDYVVGENRTATGERNEILTALGAIVRLARQ
ncbi:MAG: nucleoside phosphorylase [Paludibacterium sp.]|uniref:nucleoside phosphorylase n=1 Tax=Paludibacterium sp. TaxID=1917523 RepID=UPI0025FA29AB|nr:nucleoside phosphorylase [Paludibacterium sp.]MBV8048617.1 nucleoside phosphorylase [Paludibacterium sp.]MBV8648060.1 nucleoside phosphorylase [Paludibacterium sp.]